MTSSMQAVKHKRTYPSGSCDQNEIDLGIHLLGVSYTQPTCSLAERGLHLHGRPCVLTSIMAKSVTAPSSVSLLNSLLLGPLVHNTIEIGWPPLHTHELELLTVHRPRTDHQR